MIPDFVFTSLITLVVISSMTAMFIGLERLVQVRKLEGQHSLLMPLLRPLLSKGKLQEAWNVATSCDLFLPVDDPRSVMKKSFWRHLPNDTHYTLGQHQRALTWLQFFLFLTPALSLITLLLGWHNALAQWQSYSDTPVTSLAMNFRLPVFTAAVSLCLTLPGLALYFWLQSKLQTLSTNVERSMTEIDTLVFESL